MEKLVANCKKELKDFKMLMNAVPTMVVTLYVLSVIFANIFASKELVNISWLALDCGFLFSWMMFLCMDIITKRFGPKASIRISFMCIGINILTCAVFFLLGNIGGNWASFYDTGLPEVNDGINSLFRGNWFILAGSMFAMAVSAVVNSVLNHLIGKALKKDNFATFSLRTYVSTAIGQFIDNFIFASVVSYTLFGWTFKQIIFCSIAGAIAELLAEVIFSPVGYRICKKWDKDNVGADYLEFIK